MIELILGAMLAISLVMAVDFVEKEYTEFAQKNDYFDVDDYVLIEWFRAGAYVVLIFVLLAYIFYIFV